MKNRAAARARRLGAAVPVVSFGFGLVLLAALFRPTPALASGPEITGGGSSYAAVAINQWVAQVSSLYGDSVNYGTSSSVIGLNEFAQQQVDFGASEIGYSTGQAQYTPKGHYQYLPDVAGATCLMYNLAGRLGNQITTLKLTPAVMVGIFTGTITNWDDRQIAAVNPGVELPDKPIVTVIRSDASGENYLFSQYLGYMEPSAWDSFTATLKLPSSAQAIWPYPQGSGDYGKYNFANWVSQSGSDGASNFTAATAGAITYVETAYAILHHEPCAYVRNASGNWVAPSELTDAVGLERAQLLPDLEQKLWGVYANPLPNAYPISAYSYLITPDGPGSMSRAKGAVLGRFIRFFACTGQQAAGELGYSPLPPNLVDEDFAAINRIPGAARAPTTATAANCKNPYVDGQTPLPGEPAVSGAPSSSGGSAPSSGGGPQSSSTGPVGGSSRSGAHRAAASTSKSSSGGGRLFGGTSAPAGRATAVAEGLWPGQDILPGTRAGTTLPNGQAFGTELASEGISILGVRLSPGLMALSVLGLLLLLALPPLAFRLARRLST